ncbi:MULTISPECIES: DinB family protein [unclassified Brevibacterium]|uniref:DinB family protein n=1 Tax=unclassified Brevibacterium TaxID=2614124 RepID=UPI001E3EACAD|nr:MULTISPECIES: DinB family protein [unclassified Brevibacterium]MCD1284298.1 hypothetical protein [Brevibacterium sp. CCUG 69071]MDK8436092.1 DinB family protein [Brevibacterium sp. H-BE7]
MVDDDAMKTVLAASLATARSSLLFKLDGLSERELRLPRTPTGFNLLGVVKHMSQVEIGYFGDTFDRPWPNRAEVVTLVQIDADPQADWYATEAETAESVFDLYRRVIEFVETSVDSLPLDAVGTVPHWSAPENSVTLGQIMVHVLVDLTRHLGQVDIIRESIDGQVGLSAASPNMPEGHDWDAYSQKLRRIAERF